jgi:hypothetical protein
MKLRAQICIGLSITLISGCGTSTQGTVAPGESFVTPYMSVRAPGSGEWQVQSRSDTGIVFAGGEAGSTFVASVMLFRLGPATTPEEYEDAVRDGAAKDLDPKYPDRYELLEQSIKYTTERSYPCVRYQTVSKDSRAKGTSEPQFLEMDGLYCRHPMDSSGGAAIMYSHRGLARYAALRAEAEAFIQNAALAGK